MSARPPQDDTITLDDLHVAPYPIYRRLRAESPVTMVKATGRILLVKAEHTQAVKDDPVLFSSDDPQTPMKVAFRAHTLMRKDGEEHRRERMAMMRAFSPTVVRDQWVPMYREVAEHFVGQLERGSTVDLFSDLCEPFASRGLAHVLGIPRATDEEMARWSQRLIDGAGNFGWKPEPFALSDEANDEMDVLIAQEAERARADGGSSALAVMVNSHDPIAWSQILANIKIAIGGGINEPRDALATAIFGLLAEPGLAARVRRDGAFERTFEEAVRWCAPIQASSRRVTADTEIGGCAILEGETVMTIQASANHDEDLVADPERFDPYRDDLVHQSFGNGPHFCLGAKVARAAVGEVMLPILFDRFPNMTLPDPEVVRWRGFGFRGPVNLPVTLA